MITSIFDVQQEKRVFIPYVNKKGPVKPADKHSLISALPACMSV